MAKSLFAIFVLAIAVWMAGCTRTVVGTVRSDSPGAKFKVAIRTAGPVGEAYTGKNEKEVRIAFFTSEPESSAGYANIKVFASDPGYQIHWQGDERVTVEVVEPDPAKGFRTLVTAVFVFDAKNNRFKRQ